MLAPTKLTQKPCQKNFAAKDSFCTMCVTVCGREKRSDLLVTMVIRAFLAWFDCQEFFLGGGDYNGSFSGFYLQCNILGFIICNVVGDDNLSELLDSKKSSATTTVWNKKNKNIYPFSWEDGAFVPPYGDSGGVSHSLTFVGCSCM